MFVTRFRFGKCWVQLQTILLVYVTYINTYIQHVLFPQFHTARLLKKYGTRQCMLPNNEGFIFISICFCDLRQQQSLCSFE